jgi:hypothetical protein
VIVIFRRRPSVRPSRSTRGAGHPPCLCPVEIQQPGPTSLGRSTGNRTGRSRACKRGAFNSSCARRRKIIEPLEKRLTKPPVLRTPATWRLLWRQDLSIEKLWFRTCAGPPPGSRLLQRLINFVVSCYVHKRSHHYDDGKD